MRRSFFSFFFAALALASFAFSSPAKADSAHCLVTCPSGSSAAGQVFTDSSSCTTANVNRDCMALCNRQCGATSCGADAAFRCVLPTPSVDAASAAGTCGFTCGGSATPPNAVIPCNQDAECAAACDNVCATSAHSACGGNARCVPRAAGSSSAAPANTAGSSITLTNPLGAGVTFQTIISRIIRAMIGLVGSLALLMFIYGGIRWMLAGDGKEVNDAKNIIKYAVIGLLMIFLSYTLVSAFLSAFTAPAITDAAASSTTSP